MESWACARNEIGNEFYENINNSRNKNNDSDVDREDFNCNGDKGLDRGGVGDHRDHNIYDINLNDNILF